MPRPPILTPIDWPGTFKTGKLWSKWILEGESTGNRSEMDRVRQDDLVLKPLESRMMAVLDRDVHVGGIAANWCGDVVRHAPVMQRLADLSEHPQSTLSGPVGPAGSVLPLPDEWRRGDPEIHFPE
jgi:hypothetical protein